MSQGEGSITRTNKTPVSGAPFSAGSANNGDSVDPVTGKIVLGNDLGGVLAKLLSDREIPMDIWNIFLTMGGIIMNKLKANGFDITGDIGAGSPPLITMEDGGTGTNDSGSIRFDDVVRALLIAFSTGVPTDCGFSISQNHIDLRRVTPLVPNPIPVAFVNIDDDFSTGDPGSGKAAWRVGGVIAAASVLDPNNYVEVMINGAVVKLATIT